MPLSDRHAVAAIAFVVALPTVALAFFVLIAVGIGGGFVPLLVWPAFFVLASIWTYEISSRITGGRVGRHRFSVAAVAIGTIGGFQAGVLTMLTGSPFEPLVLSFVGALGGTYVPTKNPTKP